VGAQQSLLPSPKLQYMSGEGLTNKWGPK
jgi:hypothetical protein